MTQIFSGYTAEDVVRHQTDGHRKRYDSQGRAGAQCSLWWRNPPTLKDQRLGVIGHYSARSDEAAAELLGEVCGELAAQGCTLAVVPDRRYAGLGRLMTQQTHRNARQLGYRRVIHALMHESNTSFNISARYGQPFRRYTLFAKSL